MNIGKYLHELLLENDTVIIPGFGAFISNYKPAEIDEGRNELRPPAKEVTFNAQIRNNDGLLVGKVAEAENVSHFDALKLIEKERENIQYYLDKMGRKTLEETGELYYGEDNEILFNPVEDDHLMLESYGLESVSLEGDTEEPAPEEKQEETTLAADNSLQEESPESEEKPKTEPVDDELSEEIRASFYYPQEDAEAPVRKKKRGLLILIIILIPIIGAGIYFILERSKEKTPEYKTLEDYALNIKEEPVVQKDTTPDTITTIEPKDTVIQPEIQEEKPVAEVADSSGPHYYLVSGSFKEEENAKDYINQLKQDGITPIDLGKRGNFYIVAIGKHKTIEEAVQAKNKFDRENPNAGVWVLKK